MLRKVHWHKYLEVFFSLSFGGKVCFAINMNTVIFSIVEVYVKKKIQMCLFFPKKGMLKSPIWNKTSATWNTKYAYHLAFEQLIVLCFVYKSFTSNIPTIQILKTNITLKKIAYELYKNGYF